MPAPTIQPQETKKQSYMRRLNALRQELNYFKPHWVDLSNYVMPRNARFLSSDRQTNANKRNSKINDNTATIALRTLSSGMMSGITSPARPWFQLRTPDATLNEMQSVKEWLETSRRRISEVFLKSNLYTTLPSVYSDLGLYGASAFEVLEDNDDVIRCYGYPIGSYMLGTNDRGRVDTFYREFEMTCGNVVKRFGLENCSSSTQAMWRSGSVDKMVKVVRVVQPNNSANPNKLGSQYLPFTSAYFEPGGDGDKMLRESGFNEFSVIAPRWEVIGEDVYAQSPGMIALGDIQAMQLEQRRKTQVIDKHTNPAITVPEKMRNKGGIDTLPGGQTYVDITQGNQGPTVVYQTDLRGMQYLIEDIREIKQRVEEAFFKPLFLMISEIQRSGTTATEIAARQEEKLLALGPVYLRLNDELLDPLIDRTFSVMMRKSAPYWEGKLAGSPLLPTPPPELVGVHIQVEYISVMAQAMKAIGVQSIERFLSFAGSAAQAFPGVLDNINPDRLTRNYHEMVGAPPDLLYDPAIVAKNRADREQAAQQQQAMASADQMAGTAQKLAGAPLGDNNALSQLLGRMQSAGASPNQGA